MGRHRTPREQAPSTPARRAVAALALLCSCAAGPDAADEPGRGFGAGTASFLERDAGDERPAATSQLAPLLSNVGAPRESSASRPMPASPTAAPVEAAAREAAASETSGSESAEAEPPPATAVPAGVAAADGALRDRERELREALTGPGHVAAALDLAALLCDLERHREALAMLHGVWQRDPDPVLAVAIAGVERDLGRRHRAVAQLRALRRDAGAVAISPGLLFELASLEWLEGEAEAASATLAELRIAHADDPWLSENAARLRELETEIGARSRPSQVVLRDLLGNLRGAPSPVVRQRTLEQLVAMCRAPDAHAGMRVLERRVLAIGVGDESPAVRARAIQLGPHETTDRPAFFAAALADEAALVRRQAIGRAVLLLGAEAAPLLLARLAVEQDPAVFVELDSALAGLAAEAPAFGPLERPDAAARAAVQERWQQRRGRLGW